MMNKAIFSLILLFAGTSAWAQNVSTVEPENPSDEESITITYNSQADKASIKKADSLNLYTLFWPKEGEPVFRQFPMKKKGDIWQAKINPENPDPVFIQYKFMSGKLEDSNNTAFWDIPIYDQKGRPVVNAYLRMGDSWFFSGHWGAGMYSGAEMIRPRTNEKALEYYKKAWNYKLDDVDAAKKYLSFLTFRLNDGEKKEQIKKQGVEQTNIFVSRFDDLAAYPKALETAVYAYNRFGNTERSDSLRAILFERYYDHEASELQRYYQIFETEDDSLRIDRAQKYLINYPNARSFEQIWYQIMLPTMVKQDRGEEALTWLDEHQPENPSAYARLADLLLEKDTTDTALALQAAQKGYELEKQYDYGDKPSFATPDEWKEAEEDIKNRKKASLAHRLARAYMHSNQYQKSESLAAEAVQLRKGTTIPYNATYINVLLKNGNYQKVVEEGRKAVADNKANEELIKDLKTAFHKSKSVSSDFDQFLVEARNESARQLREKLQNELIREKAPSFTMQSLEGDSVSLDQLKGKVIILDFWSTWCGPCISAFPAYQKVVDHFKNNDEVVFWAINTWNGELNDERIKKIEEFMAEHEWSFPVLLDKDKFVNDYEVNGIPTQFMIGKEGDIRFKQVGYPGASLKQEMTVMINMLLEGEITSGSK